MDNNNKKHMVDVANRKVVVFRPDPDWSCSWENKTKFKQRVYKSTGFIK